LREELRSKLQDANKDFLENNTLLPQNAEVKAYVEAKKDVIVKNKALRDENKALRDEFR